MSMTEEERLKKENAELKKELSMLKDENLERHGYFALKKAVGEDLKEMILGLKNLKSELKIGDNETDDDTPFIETIAETRR